MFDGRPRIVSGEELAHFTDESRARDVHEITVHARISPADKPRVIAAGQAHVEVVTMTDDGVNDAHALKKAVVGIAMACPAPTSARKPPRSRCSTTTSR